MPDFPLPADAPRTTVRSYTISLLAAGGDQTSVQFGDLLTSVSNVEVINARTSVGNLSNAAVITSTNSEIVRVAFTRVNPLDEAFADASTKMVLSWQNDNLLVKTVAIPAPDIAFFTSGGNDLITPDTAAAAGTPARVLGDAIAAMTIVMNGGVLAATPGTYAFLGGYRSQRARRIPRPRKGRPVLEPVAGQQPSAAPGI